MRTHYKIKLVIDYRDINLMTKLRHHPLPDLSGVLHDLYDGLELEAIKFSTADGTSFYQCLGIQENSQKYFDFADSRAIYRTLRMEYGMVDAPSVCTSIMARLVLKLKSLVPENKLRINIESYMDDLFWTSDRDEDLEKFLHLFLQEIQDMGITLSSSKLRVGLTSIEALGHL